MTTTKGSHVGITLLLLATMSAVPLSRLEAQVPQVASRAFSRLAPLVAKSGKFLVGYGLSKLLDWAVLPSTTAELDALRSELASTQVQSAYDRLLRDRQLALVTSQLSVLRRAAALSRDQLDLTVRALQREQEAILDSLGTIGDALMESQSLADDVSAQSLAIEDLRRQLRTTQQALQDQNKLNDARFLGLYATTDSLRFEVAESRRENAVALEADRRALYSGWFMAILPGLSKQSITETSITDVPYNYESAPAVLVVKLGHKLSRRFALAAEVSGWRTVERQAPAGVAGGGGFVTLSDPFKDYGVTLGLPISWTLGPRAGVSIFAGPMIQLEGRYDGAYQPTDGLVRLVRWRRGAGLGAIAGLSIDLRLIKGLGLSLEGRYSRSSLTLREETRPDEVFWIARTRQTYLIAGGVSLGH